MVIYDRKANLILVIIKQERITIFLGFPFLIRFL